MFFQLYGVTVVLERVIVSRLSLTTRRGAGDVRLAVVKESASSEEIQVTVSGN